MPRAEIEITNKLGLHARASAKLTQLAGSFSCGVWIEKGPRRIIQRGPSRFGYFDCRCRSNAASGPARL